MIARLFALLIVGLLFGCDPGVHRTAWSKCVSKSKQMQEIVNTARKAETLTYDGVWKSRATIWGALDKTKRVNIAIGIYCDVANSAGEGKIVIIDAITGKQLASVVNGHFRE